MPGPEPHLKAIGERLRRAHLFGDRLTEIADTLLVLLENALQDNDALLPARERLGCERLAGGGDGLIDVGRGAERDLAAHLLGGRVDDIQRFWLTGSTHWPPI